MKVESAPKAIICKPDPEYVHFLEQSGRWVRGEIGYRELEKSFPVSLVPSAESRMLLRLRRLFEKK